MGKISSEFYGLGEDFAEGLRKGANICPTPGLKIRSQGRGRGLARGRGRGPIGIPYGSKESVRSRYDFGDFKNVGF